MFCQEAVSQSSQGNRASKPHTVFKSRRVFNSKVGCSLKGCHHLYVLPVEITTSVVIKTGIPGWA